MRHLFFLFMLAACLAPAAFAQGNYEIQVYGADTVRPRTTMVELHSNFTAQGQKNYVDGVAPTHHAVHETLEITQGITGWSEVGFYVFTSIKPAPASTGSATISVRACAPPIAGTGRWA